MPAMNEVISRRKSEYTCTQRRATAAFAYTRRLCSSVRYFLIGLQYIKGERSEKMK